MDDRALYVRQLIKRVLHKRLTPTSEAIGRNRAYLQQYVERGRPHELSERDRVRLAPILSKLDRRTITPDDLRVDPIPTAEDVDKRIEPSTDLSHNAATAGEIEVAAKRAETEMIAQMKNNIIAKVLAMSDKAKLQTVESVIDAFQEGNANPRKAATTL